MSRDYRVDELYIQVLKYKQKIKTIKESTDTIIITYDDRHIDGEEIPGVWIRLGWLNE